MIRIILSALFKGLTGFFAIIVMSMTLAPATYAETQVFGATPDRFDLIQVRLARTMMDVAPDLAVDGYAKVTGAPKDQIRTLLQRRAAGDPLFAQAD